MAKEWATKSDFDRLLDPEGWKGEGTTIVLNASIADVQAILAKHLKPERDLVTAVRFTSGRIEEVETYRKTKSEPPAAEVVPKDKEKKEKEDALAKTDKPEVAVTIAKPVIGCPMPEFLQADIRASRVLEAFLTDEQIRDYRSRGAFVTRGVDTGRRYLVANRERPSMLAMCGGRQLFDLEDRVPLCIHDWSVPPPEEMLALHLLLSMAGHEEYVRNRPETFEVHS